MKKTLFFIFCGLLPFFLFAKKPTPVEETSSEEVAEESVNKEECMMNISLFNESCKNKQYAEAYEPWLTVFNECPSAHKAIYTKGSDILEWKIENSKDPAEKAQLKELLMKLYDNRIKYFGNDPKYPKAYVLGLKGADYCKFFTEDPLKLKGYGWMKESLQEVGANAQLSVIQAFNEASLGLYKADANKYAEQYINDYQLISNILNEYARVNASNGSKVQQSNALRSQIDELFANSGVASCEKLDEVYGPIVKANIKDVEVLEKVMRVFRKVGCSESEVYFSAASASHHMKPTEESAAGCGRMCMKKGEYNQAVQYYEQAISLAPADDDMDKADYCFNIARIYYDDLKNYPTSRQWLKKSLEYDGNQGRCYLMMGVLYASSKPYGEGMPAQKAAILNKTVFWAAVDKFQKAKAIDERCVEDANKLIANYSKYFPTKEEMFDLPNEFKDGSFTVGGWINEKTTCRPAK